MQHSSRAQQDSSPKLLGCSQIFPDGTHSTGSPRSASIEAGLGRPVLVMASASNVTNISHGHLIEAANVGRQCRCRGGARASPPLLAGRSRSDATEPSDRGRSSVRASWPSARPDSMYKIGRSRSGQHPNADKRKAGPGRAGPKTASLRCTDEAGRPCKAVDAVKSDLCSALWESNTA